MARIIAKLPIEISIELDEDDYADEDEMLAAAAEIFEGMKIKEYIHNFNCTMVGLENNNGQPLGEKDVEWDVPEYIDTTDLDVLEMNIIDDVEDE